MPRSWPADRVERRPLDALIPYATNPRTHSAPQVDALVASIAEWGWTMPVLVDESGVLIAGHGRVLAAQKLGITEAPVMVATGWTEEQVRAYRIADNKLSLLADWDDELLAAEFQAIDGFDFTLTGFNQDEFDALFAPDNDALAEWQGMPEFEQNNKMAFKTIAVHFADAAAVQQFQELIGQALNEKTRFIWYPQKEPEPFSRYAPDESAIPNLHTV